jgi:type VI secretion system protein ImpH
MSELDDLLTTQLQQLKDDYVSKSLEVVVKKLLLIKSKHKNKLKISYKCNASLGFPSREIDDITWDTRDDYIEVLVSINFFGLQSVNSPLPLNLHEQIVQDNSSDNFELDDFYNFFNNRAIELLAESFYKKSVLSKDSSIVGLWSSISGLALQMYAKDKQIFYRLMRNADLLFGSNLSANNTAKLIEIFFEFDKVEIESFVPRRVTLKNRNITKLGKANSEFDSGFILGSEAIDIQNCCKIHAYLTDEKDYLPNGAKFDLLNDVISFLLPQHLLYTISLHLPKNIPFVLSADNIYLGWTTMVASEHQPQIVDLEGI